MPDRLSSVTGPSFTMAGLPAGTCLLQVWTTFTATLVPEHVLEHPTPQQSLAQPFTVSGWAIDAAAPSGTGVDAVHVNAYHNFGNGTPSYLLGSATYGDARTDVAAARGQRFLNSGYHFTVTGQPPGWYRFVGWSHSTASGIWTGRTVDAYVDIPTVSLEINRSGTGTGSIVGTGLSCPGGSTTQAMPCGASYALGSVVWITAVPDPGSTFAGWGGGCLGPQVTCGVTLAGDRYTFACFTKTPGTIATTCYHTDAIGSVRALSDQTGATVIRHDYLPFGEDTQPLAGDPMRFAGKELDPESALMNFEVRYYRNTWGRFTQVDPIAGSPADPQSWNRYAYARNNPLRFVDPSGLSSECATDVCVNVFGDLETVPGHASTPRFVGGGSSGQVLHFDSSSGLGIPMGWCADGSEGGIIYSQMYQCGGSPEQYDTPSFQKGGGGTPTTPTNPTADTPTNTPTNPTPHPPCGPATELPFENPIEPFVVTGDFGWRTLNGSQENHNGLDLRARTPTAVKSPFAGVVATAGTEPASGKAIRVDGAGAYSGFRAGFAHLSMIDVTVGQAVAAGQLLGKTGNTGASQAPHLHFTLKFNGKAINPRDCYPGR